MIRVSAIERPAGPRPRDRAPDGRPLAEQPQWRQDFPIDWPQDEYVARREFVKFLVLTSVAFVVGQFWIVLQEPASAGRRRRCAGERIARVDELPVGGAKTFTYPDGSTPRLLVRTGDGRRSSPTARSARTCSCPVVPAVEQGQLHCPCHNGWFDLRHGRPLAGPPRARCRGVMLEVRDGIVYATGVEESAT